MATLENLQAKIAKLQAQAEAIAKNQSSTVLAKIRELMDAHGLTIADIDAHIGGKRGRKPAGGKVAAKSVEAKYRDPKSGATWSGRGRAPSWIANTKDRTKFLIGDGSHERQATAVKKVAKPGSYVRGPQTPKYRDPSTGATWSGRGPAPAWLAGAKDRTAFLIEGAGEGATEPKATPAKKVAAKKSVARKATGKKVATKSVTARKSVAATKKGPAEKVTAKKAAARKVTAAAGALEQTPVPTKSAAGEATAV